MGILEPLLILVLLILMAVDFFFFFFLEELPGIFVIILHIFLHFSLTVVLQALLFPTDYSLLSLPTFSGLTKL